MLVALINTAVPFWLLSWGETRIDSGLASILQASVPIFNVVIAVGFFHERVTGIRSSAWPSASSVWRCSSARSRRGRCWRARGGRLALCYAVGGLMVGRYLKPVTPVVVALATTAVSAVVVLPIGVSQAPSHVPGWEVTASVIALGIPGTAIAYLLFFGLIAGAGAAYASLVTYLIPPIALVYGAVFLGESITSVAIGGLLLVLLGVALGTGTLRPSRLRRRSLASEA